MCNTGLDERAGPRLHDRSPNDSGSQEAEFMQPRAIHSLPSPVHILVI